MNTRNIRQFKTFILCLLTMIGIFGIIISYSIIVTKSNRTSLLDRPIRYIMDDSTVINRSKLLGEALIKLREQQTGNKNPWQRGSPLISYTYEINGKFYACLWDSSTTNNEYIISTQEGQILGDDGSAEEWITKTAAPELLEMITK